MTRDEKRHPGGRPKTGKNLACPECSQVFYVNHKSLRKFCGDKCARNAAKKRVFDPENGLKRCAMCKEWKLLEDFPNANRRVGGHGKQAYCRPCTLIKSNEWSVQNPEIKKAHRRTAYSKNPEKYREYRMNMSSETKARRSEYHAKYKAVNADKVRLWNKARTHTLRALGKVTRQMLLKLEALQKNKCAVCRASLDKTKKHLDHIKPVSAGGTNEFGNLQFLCASCNLAKNAREPIEFMQSRGFLL